MKKYLWVMILLAVLVIPAWQSAAQDDTSESLLMLDALAIVRDMVGTDLMLREIQYDDDDSCWKFEFSDLSEICIDDTTGEVVADDDSPEATPEATPDTDDTDDADDSADDTDDADDSDESTDDADDSADDDVIVGEPTITMEAAIATALGIFPDSTVTKIELEMTDDGLLVWDVELDDDVRSVDVNAETGTVLSFGYEDDDDNNYSDDSHDDDNDDNSGSSNDDDDDDNSGSSNDDDGDDDNSGSSDDDDSDDDNSGSSNDDDSDDD